MRRVSENEGHLNCRMFQQQQQHDLVRLVVGDDGGGGSSSLYFGPGADDRVRLIAGPRQVGEWLRSPLGTGPMLDLEEYWKRLLHDSAVLARLDGHKVAVFCLPAPAAHLLEVGALLLVQRRANCIVCHCTDNQQPYAGVVHRIKLRIIGPMIYERRAAAQAGAVHRDNLDEVDLRMCDDSGLALPSLPTLQARPPSMDAAMGATILTMLENILLQEPPPSSLRDPVGMLMAAFVHHMVNIPAGPTATAAPYNDLPSEVVYGEIARYTLHEAFLSGDDAGVRARKRLPTVMLYHAEDQTSAADQIRTAFMARNNDDAQQLQLCPLSDGHHWTLLYRLGRHPPLLLDSLCPAASTHWEQARILAPTVELAPLPVSERQQAAECGHYVITAAIGLLHAHLHGRSSPLLKLRANVDLEYMALTKLWRLPKPERDEYAIYLLNKAVAAAAAPN
jgi:hypothetical protein